MKTTFVLTDEIVDGVNASTDTLWLRGLVTYTDKFGDHHSGGYLRVFRPKSVGNNLYFEPGSSGNFDGPSSPARGA